MDEQPTIIYCRKIQEKLSAISTSTSPLYFGKSIINLLETLGYQSKKTLDWPTQPQAFVDEIKSQAGESKQIQILQEYLKDWKSAAFLFQLTDEELPTLASKPPALLSNIDAVQTQEINSFIFLALDLKAGLWSRSRLATITRDINRLFPMPVIIIFRHPRESDSAPLLSLAVIHRRIHKIDSTRDVVDGKVSIIKDIDLQNPHTAHLQILQNMAFSKIITPDKKSPINFNELYYAWLEILDVKILNDRFYKDLTEWYYWALLESTGVKFPKGQSLEVLEGLDGTEIKQRPMVALIRLLTRLIFVWFLKEKHCVPAELFNEAALAKLLKQAPHEHGTESNYYKAILQNLFFATLNTETSECDEDGHKQRVWRETSGPKRLNKYLIHTVYRYQNEFKDADAALSLFQEIPFLNGGLFECLDKLITKEDLERDPTLKDLVTKEGKQTVLRVDGFSERTDNPLHIPNILFFSEGHELIDLNGIFGTRNCKYRPRGLLKIFNSYKFTVEENTPIEEEVALDPELLGKVFENLLASYNPDTQTTARKKSGSFYTPREVVAYMVDEALISYLKVPLALVQPSSVAIDLGAKLRHLLSYHHSSHGFSTAEVACLIGAIEQMRVLDPACGSGAFPMGMLQKLVYILRKLDPQNTHPHHNTDYARKLHLIEKCLYGTDIQPIAVQITKLRFFISLVVDQKSSTEHPHLAPLPNLETKIIAANTLLPIPRSHTGQQSLLGNPKIAHKETELRQANAHHFSAQHFADKRKYKAHILRLRDELALLLKAELTLEPGDAQRIAVWDPFDPNRYADFFEPEWMFGFQDKFDIIIGNPPYVRQEAIKEQKPQLKPHYPHSYSGTADLYVYFYERSINLLKSGGCLSFITSNKWFRAKYGTDLRKYMATHTLLEQIIDFGDEAVFDALAYPTIVIAIKRDKPIILSDAQNDILVLNWDSHNPHYNVKDFPKVFAEEGFSVPQSSLQSVGWQLEPPTQRLLLDRLRKAGKPLGEYCNGRFYYGIKTGLNDAFVISREQRDILIEKDPKSAEIIKPFLRGKDIKRWNVEFENQYFIKIESSENVRHAWSGLPAEQAEDKFAAMHPSIYAWFTEGDRRQKLIDRSDQGRYFWELRSCAYWEEFNQPKIIVPAITDNVNYATDLIGYFSNDKTSIIVSEDWRYIIAILNSSISWWVTKQLYSTKQGGFFEFKPMYVSAFPIPSISSYHRNIIEPLVDNILKNIYRTEYEALLNGLVYELFFPEDLHHNGIQLFDACANAGITEHLFCPEHPIQTMLLNLQNIKVVQVIEQVKNT